MPGCDIFIESYTHAIKAKKLLLNYGFQSSISRSSSDIGCGYLLSVSAPCSSVFDILKNANISFSSLHDNRRQNYD